MTDLTHPQELTRTRHLLSEQKMGNTGNDYINRAIETIDQLVAEGDQLFDQLRDVEFDLRERVTQFPGPTCGAIDTVLRDIVDVAREVDRLERQRSNADHGELVEAVAEADRLLRRLPEQLEELRTSNHELREALHGALNNRKISAERLDGIIEEHQP